MLKFDSDENFNLNPKNDKLSHSKNCIQLTIHSQIPPYHEIHNTSHLQDLKNSLSTSLIHHHTDDNKSTSNSMKQYIFIDQVPIQTIDRIASLIRRSN